MISTFWHGWRQRRRVTAAWGCAMGEEATQMVALGVQSGVHSDVHSGDGWRVLTSLQWPMTQSEAVRAEDAPFVDASLLRQALRAPAVQACPQARQCSLSLPRSRCVLGHCTWPADWSEQEVAAQVQVEAAAALDLAPQALGFDYRPAGPAGVQQDWCWAACARSELRPLRQAFRALPLQLFAVEPAELAARRAWQHLREGPSALWSLPVADWHFERLPQRDETLELPGDLGDFPQLVACGLALAPLMHAYASRA